jgi:succinate-semialdehyde dehydrogenase/glutarate-semialdehyde dehydrogenase
VSGVADAYRIFVDGRWRASEGGATFEATSPSTGEVLGTVPEGTREDVRRAIDAANRAWPAWARLSAFDRAFAMRRIGVAIEARPDELARTLALDKGKPLRAEARDEVEELIRYFFVASEDATRATGCFRPRSTRTSASSSSASRRAWWA